MDDEGEESVENLEDTKGHNPRVWVQLTAPRREIKYRSPLTTCFLYTLTSPESGEKLHTDTEFMFA